MEEQQKTNTEKPEENKNNKTKEAIVNARDIGISLKHGIAICNYIRNKNIDDALSLLEEVESFKKAIPMKGEIPHRKGKIMSGRYPVNAIKEFKILLKSLKSNAVANELELEKYVLFCKVDVAPRPYKRFGKGRFKRAHVTLKLIPIKIKRRKK